MVIAVPVLIYHSVSDDPPEWIAPFAVAPSVFRRHLELIDAAGATPLTAGGYAEALRVGGALPERPVVITFDDGLADFRDEAVPLLEQAGFPATLFVTTGFLEELPTDQRVTRPTGRWLDGESVVDLHRRGFEIGAHSHSHPELDTLPHVTAHAEIANSRRILEGLLGVPVPTFAYPHGYQSRRVRRLVQECGFSSAFAVRNMFSSVQDDPFALARLMVRDGTSLATVKAWIEGEGAPIAPRRELVKTRGWRAYRRTRAALRRSRVI